MKNGKVTKENLLNCLKYKSLFSIELLHHRRNFQIQTLLQFKDKPKAICKEFQETHASIRKETCFNYCSTKCCFNIGMIIKWQHFFYKLQPLFLAKRKQTFFPFIFTAIIFSIILYLMVEKQGRYFRKLKSLHVS